MKSLRAQFEVYGANYDATMERFMGSESTYIKLLGLLFQDENPALLGRALEAGDVAGAFQAAHTLKGVAGNLGLTPLYGAACALVEPLRQGTWTDTAPLHAALCRELEQAAAFYQALKGVG